MASCHQTLTWFFEKIFFLCFQNKFKNRGFQLKWKVKDLLSPLTLKPKHWCESQLHWSVLKLFHLKVFVTISLTSSWRCHWLEMKKGVSLARRQVKRGWGPISSFKVILEKNHWDIHLTNQKTTRNWRGKETNKEVSDSLIVKCKNLFLKKC